MSSAVAASEEPEPENPKSYPESLRWTLAREAVCNLGLSQREASERYGLSYDALRQRCSREAWPAPERVRKLVTELSQKRSHNTAIALNSAENWAEKGEMHKILAFQVANDALKEAAISPPEIKDWADLERVDKMARRAAGLDNDDSTKVNNTFNFAMLGDSADEIQEISVSGGSEALE